MFNKFSFYKSDNTILVNTPKKDLTWQTQTNFNERILFYLSKKRLVCLQRHYI